MILLLAAAAWAGWSPAVPLASMLSDDGTMTIAAGDAWLVEPPADGDLRLLVIDGEEVPIRPYQGRWRLPPASHARVVRWEGKIDAAKLRVREGASVAAWNRWDRTVRSRPGAPPEGGERAAAATRLRASISHDPALLRLGARHDTAAARPFFTSELRRTEGPDQSLAAGQPFEHHAAGTGLLRVRLSPAALGPESRLRATIRVGERVIEVDRAVRPTTVVREAAFVPGPVPWSVTCELACVVGWDFGQYWPKLLTLPHADAPIEAAERAWLAGSRGEALPRWRKFLDQPGAAGELARARVLASTDDPAERARLAEVPVGFSVDGLETWADATLEVGDRLPPDAVAAALSVAQDPDPAALARWLDDQGGSRPRGVGWLARLAEVPGHEDAASVLAREGAARTRWTTLDPDIPGVTLIDRDEGPGVPRADLGPGADETVVLPPVDEGRFPVLRLASTGAELTLDDAPLTVVAPGGEMSFALPAGPHRLVVHSGSVRLLDAEIAPLALRRYQVQPASLPATFTLPDPGSPAEIEVRAIGPITIAAQTDDGRATTLDTRDGVARWTVGPAATRLSLSGEAGAVTVAMRVNAPPPAPIPAPEAEDRLLALVEAATQAIDAGDPDARLRRAEALFALGQRARARQDLVRTLALAPAREREVARILDAASMFPSAATAGPTDVRAAFAQARRPVPADDAVAALRGLDSPGAIRIAVREASRRDPLQAWALALRSRDPTLVDSLRAAWKPVAYPDDSAGLVSIPAQREPDEPTLARRVRDAMLAPPPGFEGALALRGKAVDLMSTTGSRFVVDLFCRDERGEDRTCEASLRFDAEQKTVTIPSGQRLTIHREAPAGRHEIEVGRRTEGTALLVVGRADERVIPVQAVQHVIRATPARPIRVVVAGGGLLSVRAVRGAGTLLVGGQRYPLGETPQIVALERLEPHPVTVEGDLDAQIAWGVAEAGADPVTLPLRLRYFPTAPPWLDALVPPLPAPGAAERLPGRLGTFSATAAFLRNETSKVPFSRPEVAVSWARRGGPVWTGARAWGHAGVSFSAGGAVSAAYSWKGGYGLAAGGASFVSREVARVDGRIRVRQDVEVSPEAVVRGVAEVAARPTFGEPFGRVDPTVWSPWIADNPVTAQVRCELRVRAWEEIRLTAGATATWLSSGIGRVGPTAGLDGVADRVTVSLRGALPVDTQTGRALFVASARVRGSFWTSAGDRWAPFAELAMQSSNALPELAVGLTWSRTGGRGLRDLGPDEEPFAVVQDLP